MPVSAARRARPLGFCSAAPWRRSPAARVASRAPPRCGLRVPPGNDAIICPGKFDAFHLGHLSLARGAAARGRPLLLSFSGMAEALGWPPRAPVVAPVERDGILRAWGAEVGRPVGFRVLPFLDVRELRPEEFVRLLVEEVGAAGVVCGRDWRFGYRAEGDVAMLEEIAAGVDGFSVRVVDGVEVDGALVSSTAVRAAIADGGVALARRLMGRPHRMVGFLEDVDAAAGGGIAVHDVINQVPGDGTYQVLVRVPGGNEPVRCFLKIRRPPGADPMDGSAGVDVMITQGSLVFCDGCEAYIDFEMKIT